MAKQSVKQIFAELKGYMGQVIKIFRIRYGAGRDELAKELKEDCSWYNADENLIEKMENGDVEITFIQMAQICGVFNDTIECALKSALTLQQTEARPIEEEKTETIRDIDYEIWKRDRQSGD